MFSATITGQIQRVIYDNKKDGADALIKITLAVPKQYVPKDSDQTHIFPLVTIFGYDAAYLRKYAGKGQVISVINAEADYYKNDKFEDDDGKNPDTVSFSARKVMFTKKAVMDALIDAGVAEPAEGDDDDDDDKPRRKKRGKKDDKKRGGKSRSERRRSRDDDDDDFEDDDEEEEEKPRRKKSKKDEKKKPSKKKPSRDDDDDDDYDDDDDDDYFDE